MNSVHDIGGMHGFGKVPHTESEPPFHEEWEGRLYGMRRAAKIERIPLDASRYRSEQMDPAFYLRAKYYERWLHGFEQAVVSQGLVTPDEIAARMEYFRQNPDAELPRSNDPELAESLVRQLRDPELSPRPDPHQASGRFRVGDRVRTRNYHPKGHTRLPRYARGRIGEVVRYYGLQDLPDKKAELIYEPEPSYAVRFDGRELWGESAEPGTSVCIDLWESYLEPA